MAVRGYDQQSNGKAAHSKAKTKIKRQQESFRTASKCAKNICGVWYNKIRKDGNR